MFYSKFYFSAAHCVYSGSSLLSEKLSVKLGKFELSVDEKDSLDIRVNIFIILKSKKTLSTHL